MKDQFVIDLIAYAMIVPFGLWLTFILGSVGGILTYAVACHGAVHLTDRFEDVDEMMDFLMSEIKLPENPKNDLVPYFKMANFWKFLYVTHISHFRWRPVKAIRVMQGRDMYTGKHVEDV